MKVYPLHLVAHYGGRLPPEWLETLEYETPEERRAATIPEALRWRRKLQGAVRVQGYIVPPPEIKLSWPGAGSWPERLGYVVGEDGRARRP